MQTILFYGRDGAKAKERAKELRKASKGKVLICDVTVWEGTKDGDRAEIMDCVSYFDRQRIEHVFGVSSAVHGTNSRGETWEGSLSGTEYEDIDPVEIAKIQARSDQDMAGKNFTSIEKIEDVIKPEPKKRGRPRKNAEAA